MRFWIEVLAWLDARPQYWLVATLGGLLSVALTLLPFRSDGPATQTLGARMLRFLTHNRFVFLAVMLVTLCVFRLPAVFFPLCLNSDESQFIAQAISVAEVPGLLPWRDYDSLTSGPLDVWALVPLRWLGLPIEYATARSVGLLLVFGGLIAVHDTLRRQFSERVARLGVLPALAFFSLTDHEYFHHYSSEQMPLFLLAVAFAGIARFCPVATRDGNHGRPTASLTGAFVVGTILGLVPHAKLQAAPVAAVLALVTLALIWWGNPGSSQVRRKRQTCLLVLGGLLPTVGLLVALGVGGGLEDFYVSSWKMPLFYASTGRSTWPVLLTMFWLPDFAAFFFPSALIILPLAGLMLLRRRAVEARHYWLVGSAVLWFLASVYVVLQPGRPITHYMLLIVLPLTVLTGAILGTLLASEHALILPGLPTKLLGTFFLAATILPGVATRACGRANPYLGDLKAFLSWPPGGVGQAMIEAATIVNKVPGERSAAAVWGWEPELFQQSGSTLGTRDAVCQFQIFPGPLRTYYRHRFLSDLQRNRPALFVEAIAPSRILYTDRQRDGFETFPELAHWIAVHYELFREVDGERVYRRKD